MTARAFVRRDILFETSYKLQSLMTLCGPLFQILMFFFLARFMDDGVARSDPHLRGGNYFTFVLVGIAFREMFDAGLLMQFTTSLRQQLSAGVFEAMCATPLGPAQLMFYSLLWPAVGSLLKACFYLLLGAFLLDAEIGLTSPLVLLAAVTLSICVFGSLGMIAGSLILYFKRGDPVTWFLSSLVSLVGGVFFPVSVLPAWLRGLSYAVPIPYALDALRASLIPSMRIEGVGRDLLALAAFAAVLLPTAWYLTTKLFELSRRQGGLGQH